MKKIILILSLGFAIQSIAQESEEKKWKDKFRINDDTETLANRNGGFGAFLELNTLPTYINNQPAIMSGGGIALVFGHSLNLGFSGYGLVTQVASNTQDSLGNFFNLQTGFGGLTIEPVFFSKKLIHFTVPVLFGAGVNSLSHFSVYDSHTYHSNWTEPELYFITKPGINIEINLLRILRLDFGVAYRFTTGSNLQFINPSGLNGWSGNIGIKLGWF